VSDADDAVRMERLLGAEVALAGVEKRWADTLAVSGVDLLMPAGKFTALLGPSGCGKSTTLRMIAGLETPTAGVIRIAGRDVTRASPSERNVSMVFQSYGLFPHLTVAENIVFGLRVKGVGRAERERRLDRVAQLLELTAQIDRKPAQLSGGQQQRVALGRAIISERPVCLMDEPLSNLDARLRHDMRAELRALQRRLGFTMIYVTHDQVEAVTMADQVALMRDGALEQAAAPKELYRRPATLFAARFIGTPPMNVLAPAAFGERGAAFPAAGIQVGIRPEDLRLDPAGPLAGAVIGVEFLGGECLVACAAAGERFVAKVDGAFHAEAGEEIRFGFAPEAVHAFDIRTGGRTDEIARAVARRLCGTDGA